MRWPWNKRKAPPAVVVTVARPADGPRRWTNEQAAWLGAMLRTPAWWTVEQILRDTMMEEILPSTGRLREPVDPAKLTQYLAGKLALLDQLRRMAGPEPPEEQALDAERLSMMDERDG